MGRQRGRVFTRLGRHVQSCSVLTLVKAPFPHFPHVVGMAEQPLMNEAGAQIISLPQETQFAANGIVSRTLLRTAHGRVVLFGFAEGQELTEHTSTQHALVQVLSGECDFTLAGQLHILQTGDLLNMPPNLPHAVKARGPFSMLLTLFKP